MAQWLLDEICDRLTDAGLFRHAIKRDYKRITSLLSKESERTIERYCKDERESGEACTAAEFATFHKFLSAYMDIWFNVYVIVVSPSSIISFEQCGVYYYARVFGNRYVFVLDAFDG